MKSNTNYFLKIDIFCLSIQEKFDEANLLNSLLIESGEIDDSIELTEQDDFTMRIGDDSPLMGQEPKKESPEEKEESE